MASITIAPRLEDPTSDIESVVTGGTVQIRISAPVSTGGQWLLPIWSPVLSIDGAPVVVLLDPNATVPYEARFDLPTGDGDRLKFTEFRKVVDATPRAWDTLEQVGGPSAPAVVTSAIQSQLDAINARIDGISASGSASLGTISDMAPYMRTVNVATNATSALATLTAAPLASPALTGNPTAPTPTTGDNDTSIATTAFVQNSLAGTGLSFASAALTGNPTAPTPTTGDNDTSIATTAFVQTAVAGKAPLNGSGLVDASNIDPAIARQTDVTAAFASAVNPDWSNVQNRPVAVGIQLKCPGDVARPRSDAGTVPAGCWVIWRKLTPPPVGGPYMQDDDEYERWNG